MPPAPGNRGDPVTKSKRQTGLTLIEIMIAVAILAIISAIAIPLYQGYVVEARFGTAAKDLAQIQVLLDDLATENSLAVFDSDSTDVLGVYRQPSGRVVLGALATAPAGSEAWLDPWGRIYRYQRPALATQEYRLFSQAEDTSADADDVRKRCTVGTLHCD
jgi:prepilin-type N-terminal cleavage/methylation domain-containing protein